MFALNQPALATNALPMWSEGRKYGCVLREGWSVSSAGCLFHASTLQIGDRSPESDT